ncbi:MAG: nucleotidyltransferase domain-containing protein [Ardenticatenia bacterium]|nr:nucleotidyltransferase domain-containing protein [Ardenticatenia bacterium]
MTLNLESKERISLTLKGRPEIRFGLLHGSAAHGQPFRDLDIGVWVDRVLVPTTQDLAYAFVIATDLEKTVSCLADVRVINDAPLPSRCNVS